MHNTLLCYYTKARLAKIFHNVSPACDRRHLSPTNITHMFWLCPALHNFWTEVFQTVSVIAGHAQDADIRSALFGVLPLLPSPSSTRKAALALATLLTRKLILIKWKSAVPPTHIHWIRDILAFLKLERFDYP